MKGISKILLLTFAVFFLVFSTQVRSDEIQPVTGQDTHLVVKGDTLWDLSGEFYTNPFLWPVLWARNPKITNPHLIYPEDLINLKPAEKPKKRIIEKVIVKEVVKEIPVIEIVEIEEEPEEKDVVFVEPVKKEEPVKVEPPPKEPTIGDLLSDNRLSTYGYYLFERPDELGLVQGGIEARMLMSQEDLVYVNIGTEHGVQKGNKFSIVSITKGPTSREFPATGYIVKILGEIIIHEVLSEDQSVGIITNDYAEITRGAILLPAGEEQIDLEAKITYDVPDVEDMIIVAAQNNRFMSGEAYANIVYLNKGSNDGLQTGHKLSVFRKRYIGKNPRYPEIRWPYSKFPEEKVGEVVVIYTTEETATAIVVPAPREIMMTDREIVFADRVRKNDSNFYK